MDLNYDYGDVVHAHGHLHTRPESHRQVVEHALKDWCHTLFGEEAEEKCNDLNEIKFHDIDDGTHSQVKISDIYNIVKNLSKLSGRYMDNDSKEYDILIKGTTLIINKEEKELTISRNKDNNFIFAAHEITPPPADSGSNTIYENQLTINESGMMLGDKKLIKLKEHNGPAISDFDNLEYDNDLVDDFKQIFRNLDMKELVNQNEILNKNLDAKKKELTRSSNMKIDDLSAERRLQNLEKLEKEKKNEIIVLILFLIFAIMFGIYCIYTHFNLEL